MYYPKIYLFQYFQFRTQNEKSPVGKVSVWCFNMQWPAFSNHSEAQYWKYIDLADVDQFLGDAIAIHCKLQFAVIYSRVSHCHLTLSVGLCFTLKAESRRGILFPHLLFSQLCISTYWRLEKWANAAYEVLNRKIHELNDSWDTKASWEREVWNSDKTEAMDARLGSLHTKAIHIGLLKLAFAEERHRGKDGGSTRGRWTSRRSLEYAKSFILLMWIGSKALEGHWLPSCLHSHTVSSIQELNGEHILIHLKSFTTPLASDPPVLQLIGNRLWHEVCPSVHMAVPIGSTPSGREWRRPIKRYCPFHWFYSVGL